MAWADHSVAFAIQDDLNTETSITGAGLRALHCEPPTVTFETESTEVRLNKGQVGAAADLVVGRRKGKITVRMPVEAGKIGRNAATENPGGAPAAGGEVLPPWLIIVANALGCNVEALAGGSLSDKNTNFWRGTFLSLSAYGAAKVSATGTNTTNIQGDAGQGAQHKAGQLIAAATSATVRPFLGFVKTKVVDLMTVFEASPAPTANYDDDNANIYGTATAWQSDDQPRPLTCYWTGPNVKECYVLIGCVCDGWTYDAPIGQIPTIEFSFAFQDYYMDKTKGGLIVPPSQTSAPQLIGNRGAYAMLNAATKCGLEGMRLSWAATLREGRCHGAPQGVQTVTTIQPRIRCEFTVDHDATNDVVYDTAGTPGNVGSHQWQYALEARTSISLGVYVGSAINGCLAFLIPAGKITATPTVADRDGVIAYTVQLDAQTYADDSTDTAETSNDSPIDSLFRIGFA